MINIHNNAVKKFSVIFFVGKSCNQSQFQTQKSLTIADVRVCLGGLRKVHFNFVSINILTLHSSPCSEINVFRCLIRTHSELVSDWLKVIRYG